MLKQPTIQEIEIAIRRERSYQDEKWGTIAGHPHTVGEWLLIMEKELREAKGAWISQRGDIGALEEILHVIAVGCACLEQHGIVERFNAPKHMKAAVFGETRQGA